MAANSLKGGNKTTVLRGGLLIPKESTTIVSHKKLLLYNIGGYIYAQNERDYHLSVRFYLFEQVIYSIYIIYGVAPFKTPLLL